LPLFAGVSLCVSGLQQRDTVLNRKLFKRKTVLRDFFWKKFWKSVDSFDKIRILPINGIGFFYENTNFNRNTNSYIYGLATEAATTNTAAAPLPRRLQQIHRTTM
jgi:hypothetical protein